MWTRPYHLSAAEARDWACTHVSGLAGLEMVRRAELTPVRAVSRRHPVDCEWMLELHLVPGRDARELVDEPASADWLLDLQQLGMRPRIILVDGGIALGPHHR